MKKSNKKRITNKKLKEKVGSMRNKEKNNWKQSDREGMFMNQNTNNQEFNDNETNAARFHRQNGERYAPEHRGFHHSEQCRPHDRQMGIGRGMRSHRRLGRRQYIYEVRPTGRGDRFHAHRMDRRSRDWHHRGYHHRHHKCAQEQTMMLLYEKQRLERRLGHMKRRLHALNHQLHAQIG